MRASAAAGLMVFGMVSCGGGPGSSEDMATQPDAGPLPVCIQGWFLDPTDNPCGLCGAAQTPECSQTDCVQKSFAGFLQGAVHYDGIITYSAKGRTMSTVSTAKKDTYAVVNATTIDIAGKPVAAVCSFNEVTLGGFSKSRASVGLAAAFDGATASGAVSWTGVAVAQ